MSLSSSQTYQETDRREDALAFPELPAPLQAAHAESAESAESIDPQALAVDYAGGITAEEIAAEAYALYEARGCEAGHDVDDWLAAEALIRQRRLSN